jgi:hypothetical protein
VEHRRHCQFLPFWDGYNFDHRYEAIYSSNCYGERYELARSQSCLEIHYCLQYTVPPERWSSPSFFKINLILTCVWTLYFGLLVMFSLLYAYFWVGNSIARILPSIVLLLMTLKFTYWFPDYYRSKMVPAAMSQQGDDSKHTPSTEML